MREKLIHFSSWSDIKDHWKSDMCHLTWESDGARWTWWDNIYYGIVAAKDVFKMRWLATVCEFRGHDYETDGRDYPEDGGEGFTCKRCGYSFTAWH